MKKRKIVLWVLALSVLLILVLVVDGLIQSKKTKRYSITSSQISPVKVEGSATKMSILITSPDMSHYKPGDFMLSKKQPDGNFLEVEPITTVEQVTYWEIIDNYHVLCEQSVSDYYGDLPKGEYRVEKEIIDIDGPRFYNSTWYKYDFIVP